MLSFWFNNLKSQWLFCHIPDLNELALLNIFEAENEFFGMEADSLLILSGNLGLKDETVGDGLVENVGLLV